MLGEGVEIGDKLIVKVAKENRDWGYNPCPDGIVVPLVSFGEITYNAEQARPYGIEPGVYVNRCWFDVRLPNGKTDCISCCFFEPVDKQKYEQKIRQWRMDHPSFLYFEYIRTL